MGLIADILVGVVALEHLWFLFLEMFLWTKPIGIRTFRQTEDQARASAALAANQGLYNGFLAAGLVGLLCPRPSSPERRCSSRRVVVAGAFAFTASRSIPLAGGPAAVARSALPRWRRQRAVPSRLAGAALGTPSNHGRRSK
jgi:putative membrane protein